MPEDDSPSQDRTTGKRLLPPVILGTASFLWKLIDVLDRIDFILRIKNPIFWVFFQFFVSYGWLVLVVGSAIWGFVEFRKKRPEEVGFKTTWGMVVAVGLVAFLYGVLITVNATGDIPEVKLAWGPTPTGCYLDVDTSRLSTFRNKYYLLVVCGLSDPAMDKLQQTAITISKPFEIIPGEIRMFAQYGPEMARLLSQGIIPADAQGPMGAAGCRIGDGYMWFLPVLLPKDAELSKITNPTLSDVRKQGGKILSHTYYE